MRTYSFNFLISLYFAGWLFNTNNIHYLKQGVLIWTELGHKCRGSRRLTVKISAAILLIEFYWTPQKRTIQIAIQWLLLTPPPAPPRIGPSIWPMVTYSTYSSLVYTNKLSGVYSRSRWWWRPSTFRRSS